MKKYQYLLLAGIIIYGGVLRIYDLESASFWIDEGFSSYSSLHTLGDLSQRVWREYFLHNLSQILSFSLLGVSDFSARLPSVIFGGISGVLIFLIARLFWKNISIAFLGVFLYTFHTWEIIWSRQARFYSLLEMMFLGHIFLLLSWYKSEKKIYMILAIITIYLGILFHPFLYISLALALGVVGVKWMENFKHTLKKSFWKNMLLKNISLWMTLVGILIIEILKKFVFVGKSISIPSTHELPEHFKQFYIYFYSEHLLSELGVLIIVFFLALGVFAYLRKFLELGILGGAFMVLFFIISQKGYLMHSRYMLLVFPLVFLGSSFLIGSLVEKIPSKSLKYIALFLMIGAIFYTGHYTFIPKGYYQIDYTSPQPDFKGAYASIPDGEKIISGFPMLCEWYYAHRGECVYALPIDYVGNAKNIQKVLERGVDNYTFIPYIFHQDDIKGERYYFVMDHITLNRSFVPEIKNFILSHCNQTFTSMQDEKVYNTIEVWKCEE